MTGEHGVGMIKRDYLDHELGQSTVDTMRKVRLFSFQPFCSESTIVFLINTSKNQLKQALDPLCLLNCDKVIRMEQPKREVVQPW